MLTDADYVRLATKRGRYMLGPAESEECHQHPDQTETYRWTWRVNETPEEGDAEYLSTCPKCLEEINKDED